MKRLLTYALLVLALVASGYVVKKRVAPPAPAASVEPDTVVSAVPADGVVVTYFTTDIRCPSCVKIEEFTRETVETRFADRLKSGDLVFRTLNMDRPENKHFAAEYELVSKTVIVSFREDGKETRFENLQDVWLKLDDRAEFADYVATAID